MKNLLCVLMSCAIFSAHAAFPLYEPFADATANGGSAYLVGSKVAGQTNANGPTVVWADNNTAAVDIGPTNATGNLSYAGMPASSGNMSYFTNVTARTTRVTLPSTIVTGTAYYSYKIQITGIGNLSASGAYLNGFSSGTGTSSSSITTLGARLWAKKIDADHYVLGVSKNTASVTAEIVFDTTQYTTNDVLFIVGAYTFSGSANNDTASLWINPGSLGAASAPAATLANTGTGFPNASATIASFLFGNRATTIASGFIDDIRVATNWKDVTGGVTITGQPVNSTKNAGESATFTVNASGTGISYQWKKNGVNLVDGGNVSGSTTATLTLNGVFTADADIYTVDVSGSNTETSSPATLTVVDPAITTHPVSSLILVPGSTTNLTIAASGTPTLSYQWQKNGVNLTDGGSISGATTASLTLTSVSAADDGSYACAVTNGLGAGAISSASAVSVANDPDILTQPSSVTTNYGAAVVFSVSATGTAPLTYQWQKNGSNLTDGGNISGAMTASLTIISAGDLDEGSYSVIVTNGNNQTVTSSSATLTVSDPIINSQPISITNLTGTEATFTVGAAGTPALTYQWRKGGIDLSDGSNISGATTATLTISNVATNNAGSYSVIVSNSVGSSVTSSTANLTVHGPPIITSTPAPRTVNVGVNVAFSVAATTTIGSLSYQWQSDFVDIDNATNAVLSLANVQEADSAIYSVNVSNPAGVTTASAALVVTAGNLRLFNTNLIVLRHGAADQALANVGNTISLDQFTTTGDYVSTTVIPDSGANALIADPILSTFAGGISLSANRKELAFGGFNTNRPHSASLTASSTASAPSIRRAVGKVNGLSSFAVGVSHTSFSQNTPRGSATDGTNNFWGGGGNQGTRYLGAGSSPVLVSGNGSSTSIRQMKIINDVLYFSTSSSVTAGSGSPLGIWKYSGLPTAVEAPVNVINTLTGSSPGEFALRPDGNIMYVADERTTAAGGVQRWTNNAGVWSLEYTITNGIAGFGARGLAADFSGPDAVIYGTTAELSNNRLFVVVDTGASSTALIIARSGLNQAFRGVEFGPNSDSPTIATQPVSVTNFSGAAAIFSATASGTGPFSYQWQKDGVNLVDGGTISGATTPTLTISSLAGTDAANTPGYTMVVTNELGVATSSPATLTIAGPPTIDVAPSTIAAANQGADVTFVVQASGVSLSYQWDFEGTAMAGATDASVTIAGVTGANVGTYTVTVSNGAGLVSASADLSSVIGDAVAPTVAFKSPGYGKGTNQPIVVLEGIASDKKAIAPASAGFIKSVKYVFNFHLPGAVTNNAILSSGAKAGITNWATAPVTLVPGTNTLKVMAYDLAGNEVVAGGTFAKGFFYYNSYSDLTVNIEDGGPKTNGTVYGLKPFTKTELGLAGVADGTKIPLLVGRPYTMNALVGKGTNYVFTNWFGVAPEAGGTNFNFVAGTWSVASKAVFHMQSNLTVTANFITNPFTPVAGKYNGLFSDTTNGVAHHSAGFVYVSLSEKSGFSGKVLVDGDSLSMSGKFDAKGEVTKTILRPKQSKGPLTVFLKLDWYTGSDVLTGTVSDGTYVSEINANRTVFDALTRPETNFNGRYTMIVPRTNYPGAGPGGMGYAVITNDTAGTVLINIGNLGDGEKFVQKVSLAKDGYWPMFAPLYKSLRSGGAGPAETLGVVMGWLQFSSKTNPPAGSLDWIKKQIQPTNSLPGLPGMTATKYYGAGFTNNSAIIGSPYAVPALESNAIDFVNGVVTFADGNLSQALSNQVTVTPGKVFTTPVTNKVTVALVKKTGQAVFTFLHPETAGRKSLGWGAVLQNQTNAIGYFQGTNVLGGDNHYGTVELKAN